MSGSKQDVYEISDHAGIDLAQLFEEPKSRRGGAASANADGKSARRAAVVGAATNLPTDRNAPLAGTLSILLCGAGQAYNGQLKMGLLFFLIEVLTAVSHAAMARIWPTLVQVGAMFEISERNLFVAVGIFDLLFVIFFVWQVIQAYLHADTWGRGHDGVRFPIVPALASAVIPGWGQIFNAQPGKAAAFLFLLATGGYCGGVLTYSPTIRELVSEGVSQATTLPMATLFLAAGFAAGTIWILSVYDAYLVARYRR